MKRLKEDSLLQSILEYILTKREKQRKNSTRRPSEKGINRSIRNCF